MSEHQVDFAPAPSLNEPPEWLRLNGMMVIVSPLKEVVRAAIPLVAVFFAGGGAHSWGQWLSLAGVALLIARGVTHWATASYRITDDQVELRSGLFNRKTRAVPRDRIRTVDITSEWQHRLFGLSALKIGTGRQDKGKDDELTLDAITKTEAERLRTVLLTKTSTAPSVVDSAPVAESELVRVDRRWTWYAPFTLSGIAVVAAAFGAVWHFANDLRIRPDDITILRETNVPSTFVYYHVELANHALILAEGAPAETFIDNVDRMAFENWEEHERLYGAAPGLVEMDLPRAKASRQVPRSVRKMTELRAAALGYNLVFAA